jgi:hypothetical protein
MIPYFHSGFLVKFRCTDCNWTYCIQNPVQPPSLATKKKERRNITWLNSEEVAAHFSEQKDWVQRRAWLWINDVPDVCGFRRSQPGIPLAGSN